MEGLPSFMVDEIGTGRIFPSFQKGFRKKRFFCRKQSAQNFHFFMPRLLMNMFSGFL